MSHPSPSPARSAALAIAGSLLAACASLAPAPGPSRYRGDLTGLERIRNWRLDEAYQRPGVRLADYTGLLIEPVELAPDLETDFNEYTDHDLDWVRRKFREALAEALAPGFQIVEEPGPGVLRVRALLTGVKANRPPLDISRRGGTDQVLSTARGVGWATTQLELRDAGSGELLFAAVDRYDGVEFTSNLSPEFTWSDARRAFAGWGRALREHLEGSGFEG